MFKLHLVFYYSLTSFKVAGFEINLWNVFVEIVKGRLS